MTTICNWFWLLGFCIEFKGQNFLINVFTDDIAHVAGNDNFMTDFLTSPVLTAICFSR
ncbi:hypothetical protein [uncultured Methanobrevibacter sp.]|uniref:hypothetical protein n=1 Tax=uncultured Methanobrevibacter sp. TaxID=253161 RepID=UPI0025E9D9E5|nr:hypothetical protein [uncultured Methanobrevibacter sp.]